MDMARGARRRKRKKLRLGRLLFVVLCACAVLWGAALLVSAAVRQFRAAGTESGPLPRVLQAETPPPTVLTDEISSRNALLMRRRDGRVFCEKQPDAQAYPASLTKMMTALVALEQIEDLTRTVEVPAEIFDALYREGASVAGFLPGERARAIDLVYGVLLPSGADAAQTLAMDIAGSEEAFVSLMNERAAGLGMTGTHFANVSGLTDADHYTTARDMAKLADAALDNAAFREIFTAKKWVVAPTNAHPDGFTMTSTLFSNMESTELADGAILGGKTGYTGAAGLCLASVAEIEGEEYILVTLGAAGTYGDHPMHFADARTIYQNYAGSARRSGGSAA